MKKQILRFTYYAIIVYLFGFALNLAASQPSGGNGTHVCGVVDYRSQFHRASQRLAKQHSDQFPNRHYARAVAANLNVGDPRTVRLIYFLPNDWSYRADVVQKMKDTIRTVQTFYTEQMEAHGYGQIAFRFETDSKDEPMVHHVDGRHPFSYYDNTLGYEVFFELEGAFDFDANIYFIVLGTDALRQGNGEPSGGVGSWLGKNGGWCLVPNQFSWDTVAHELGHSFGLGHDFRSGAYIMSYGFYERPSLSTCAADFLSVHSYFNPDTPIEEEQPPTIELISPRTYPPDSASVPVRVKVSDSDGLHQVLLHAEGALQMCRRLTGDKEALIDFDYAGGFGLGGGFRNLSSSVIHSIRVDSVDTDGNISETFFSVLEISPYHITTLEGHTDRVTSVSFSPDNTTLASGSWDGTVKLWDVTNEANIATFTHEASVNSVLFSPDGTNLASGGSGVKLWNVATEENIATFWPFDRVNSISFSRDGATLASGDDYRSITLWDVATEENIVTFTHGNSTVMSVSLSPTGTTVASGSWDGTVKLWDVATEANIATFTHEASVNSVLFSPDGATLASGGFGRRVKLWDVATGANIVTLMHGAPVFSVSFSDGDTLASGGGDSVKLWDMTTSANFATFPHTSVVNSVSFSPDGTLLASGTEDGMVELWDMSGLMGVRLETHTEVDIPDPNLRAAIAEAIGLLPNTSILRGHLQTLSGLYADRADINDLTGLEGATNLTGLSLWDNHISDFSPLLGLTNLTALYIGDAHISDLSSLSGLTSLTRLHLSANNITDISALSGLTSLIELWLDGNNITDISALSGLTNLTRLRLSANNITDISALSGLTNLTRLHLSANNITDLSPLVANAGLGTEDFVDIRGNPLSYLSLHAHIPALQRRGVAVQFDAGATRSPDVNSDGSVNVLDLLSVASSFGPSGQSHADVNRDGVVNILDVVLVAGMFDELAAAPSAHRQVGETLTVVEVQQWLIDIKTLEVDDPLMKRGIEVLEQLLYALTPQATMLLANYPNPFNPETWIPYTLAEDATVEIAIYDVQGVAVRRFDVGYQLAGYYTDKAKAVYWDGRNGHGESVASGMYFYQLCAGDHSQLRRLVILQ